MKNNVALYKFFGLDKIYNAKYGLALIIDPLLAVFVTFLVTWIIGLQLSEVQKEYIYIPILLASLWLMFLFAEIVKALYVRRVRAGREQVNLSYIKNSRIMASAVTTEQKSAQGKSSTQIVLISYQAKSGLYDVAFNHYRETKYGDFIGRQTLYTAYETKLQRLLPHLVFDSKRGKGKQFKNLFLKAQRLTLDVNFDDYFDTYSPKNYHIDTLSFITPEVLQAMIALKDYDIEIVDDSLIVFAPFLNDQQLEEFKAGCQELYRVLNDNLNAYRDDRLVGTKRTKDVTGFSKRLLESPMRYIPAVILSGLMCITAIIVRHKIIGSEDYRNLLQTVSICGVFAAMHFVTYGYKLSRVLLQNRQLEKQFAADMQITQVIKKHKSGKA